MSLVDPFGRLRWGCVWPLRIDRIQPIDQPVVAVRE
jgi:hypothetical protein